MESYNINNNDVGNIKKGLSYWSFASTFELLGDEGKHKKKERMFFFFLTFLFLIYIRMVLCGFFFPTNKEKRINLHWHLSLHQQS